MFMSGGKALEGSDREKSRGAYQTLNATQYNPAVRLRGRSSGGQKGNSPDLKLRSQSVC